MGSRRLAHAAAPACSSGTDAAASSGAQHPMRLRREPAATPPEVDHAIGLERDLPTEAVHEPVTPAAQQQAVGLIRRAAIQGRHDVVRVGPGCGRAAPREAAVPVPRDQRGTQPTRNRPRRMAHADGATFLERYRGHLGIAEHHLRGHRRQARCAPDERPEKLRAARSLRQGIQVHRREQARARPGTCSIARGDASQIEMSAS